LEGISFSLVAISFKASCGIIDPREVVDSLCDRVQDRYAREFAAFEEVVAQ
jgi:hypothetical protein